MVCYQGGRGLWFDVVWARQAPQRGWPRPDYGGHAQTRFDVGGLGGTGYARRISQGKYLYFQGVQAMLVHGSDYFGQPPPL